MSEADPSACINSRFPVYQQLLERDRRDAKRNKLRRRAVLVAAIAISAWIAAH